MVFTNVTPFPREMTPITNISPLTYRDASTFLEYLETIRQWLNETLVPDSNDMIANAITEFQAGIANAEATVTEAKAGWQGQWNEWTADKAAEYLAFVQEIDGRFTSFTNSVNQNMTDAALDIQASKDEWLVRWTAFTDNVELELAALSDSAAAGLVETPTSELNRALAARTVNNILDYGVVRGTTASQTEAIKAAFDANPGEAFYFPPGDYRLDTGLVISKANSVELADGARIYAGAAMETLITFFKSDTTDGFYALDKAFTGGLLDGNLLANRGLSIKQVIRYTHTRTNYKDFIKRGLVLEGGPGAEVFSYDLRFYNTTTQNVADNIAIEAFMGDCHFSHIVMRDWTVGYKGIGVNKLDRVHPWISPDNETLQQCTARWENSIAFDITGGSDLTDLYADTYRVAYKIRSNGTAYTTPPLMQNLQGLFPAGGIPVPLITQFPACAIDNTDGVGVDSDRMFVSGHSDANGMVSFVKGPTTNLNTRNTVNQGFVAGVKDYIGGAEMGYKAWTPKFEGSTGAGVHVYTVQNGEMNVLRDSVIYTFHVKATLDATAAFSGGIRITGLPSPAGSNGLRNGSGPGGMVYGAQIVSHVLFGGATPRIVPYALDPNGVVEISADAKRGTVLEILTTVTVPFSHN